MKAGIFSICDSPSAASMHGLAKWISMNNGSRKASRRRKHSKPFMAMLLQYAAFAISRHEQITPPRSKSPTSCAGLRVSAEQVSQSTQQCTRKVEIKTEESPKQEATAITKKHKGTRKSIKQAKRSATVREEDTRRISLEKNRLAAAKCRINKREKIAQLQRDSHDKAAENTYLRQTIMQKEEEVQELKSILMSNLSSDHCKDSESIHKALGTERSDSFTSQMFTDYFLSTQPQQETMRQLSQDQNIHSDYFEPREAPALPEFNLSADFEICTPMLDD
jgi:bZIP transcription factor